MRGTIPIQMCDDEDGCTEWMIDNYEMTVDNWREFLAGWHFDPCVDRDYALCPKHNTGRQG